MKLHLRATYWYWLHSFIKIWQIYIDPREMLCVLNQMWSAPMHLRKYDLGLAMPICAARHLHCLFTCADENNMTVPTVTRKICMFFFTGLDRSCLTNLDRSRFVRFWKRTQPMSLAIWDHTVLLATWDKWTHPAWLVLDLPTVEGWKV